MLQRIRMKIWQSKMGQKWSEQNELKERNLEKEK